MSTLSSNPTQSGPSRRSHTKSRKGCKTCKRRHIRCDETFPQCRNCTKHQVRCDYMDASPVPAEPAQAGAMPLIYQPSSAEVETLVDYWIKTGDCTVGDTHIDLNAHGHSYSKVNLRCIYHALSFNMAPETGAFTVWSAKTPRFLQAATAQPFLVHAVLGFGSLAMSWEQGSSDAKSMAHHHGGVALQGLRRAISAFSVENADAVLAASCLLSWQANDWQSWASLINGIRTVVNSMQAWRRDSPLAEIIDEQELAISEDFLSFARSPPVEQSALYYASVLHKIHSALHHLERYLGGRPQDSQWIGQIKDYIERLQAVRPASTPEEQFNHLYAFRKWLFWVPQTLLKSSDWDHMTLIVLSYIYGIALELEPLFPNVASPFISTMSVKPLEEIIGAFLGVPQPEAGTNDSWDTMLQLLAWPRQAAADYRIRGNQQNSGAHMRLSPPSFDMMGSALSQYVDTFSMGGARSPAFGYSPASQVSPISTSSTLSFLDVPAYSDTVGSGGFPSPFVLASMTSEAEAMEATYGFEDTTLSFGGTSGFVDLKPIWT